MLILGGRYGSIEPISGISYTELEYDYACQQSKPLFAVVITENYLDRKIRDHGRTVLEDKDPNALKLFREKVLSNVSSFFSDEKDIRLCVHESLAELQRNRSIKGWVFADDVEDTQPLHEQILRLRDEIIELKMNGSEKLQKEQDQKSMSQVSSEDYDNLLDILHRTEVSLPSTLISPNGVYTQDLLSLFVNDKERLINGVSEFDSGDKVSSFFYFNICPKLMVHGLVSSEEIPGTRYRRSFSNTRGLALLAEIERRFDDKRLTKDKVAKMRAFS